MAVIIAGVALLAVDNKPALKQETLLICFDSTDKLINCWNLKLKKDISHGPLGLTRTNFYTIKVKATRRKKEKNEHF